MYSLPHEILRHIFSFLDNKERRDLLTLSKSLLKFNYQDLPIHAVLKKGVVFKEGGLISKLTSITLMEYYQGDLPEGLRVLKLKQNYNYPLPKLPENLNTLILGWKFNQALLNLPESLRILDLGKNYDKPLPKLPKKLKSLVLAKDTSLHQPLPESLQSLTLTHTTRFNDQILLPKSLEFLTLETSSYGKPFLPKGGLPEGLKGLILGSCYNFPLPSLPESLESLELGWTFDQPLTKIPDGLRVLILGGYYDQLLPKLPGSLHSLILGTYYNQVFLELPENLNSLVLGWGYDQPLPKLPGSLESLTVGQHYNQPLPVLPEGLKSLILGGAFTQPLPILPRGLKSLTFHQSYVQSKRLQESLQSFTLNTIGFFKYYTRQPCQ